MFRILTLLVLLFLCGPLLVSAQTPRPDTRKDALARLKQYFEGKKVIVRIDMPATREGIDLRPERPVPLDSARYQRRIADFGVSIPRGETAVVTMVELGNDDLEFHLDGGGYGSGRDIPSEPQMPVQPNPRPQTQRELEFEEQLRTETNRARIDYLRSELNRERRIREDEDRRALDDYQRRVDERASIIRDRRLRRGSRFIIRFTDIKTPTVTPEMVLGYLREYLDFPDFDSTPSAPVRGVDDVKPYAGAWRNGRGATLTVTAGSWQYGNDPAAIYREIFRIAEARLFVVEFRVQERPVFVLVELGDGDMKLKFYDSISDLQRGSNLRSEETWQR